jgi:quercetin dioxygenase-like cupin family protein
VKEMGSPNDIEKNRFLRHPAILLGMIGYQEGAIVSRTIIDKDSGTVTLFAFDEGQGLSEHIAPYDALVYMLEGQVAVTISGVIYHLNEGEIIIMPANQPHALRAATKFKMVLTMIKS